MTERIEKLLARTLAGEMWFEPTPTEYDRCDLFLDPREMNAKREYEYILNQNPLIPDEAAFAGIVRFDGTTVGECFHRHGQWTRDVHKYFYLKPIDNLVTHESQHSVGDFGRVLEIGMDGIREIIARSKVAHPGHDEQIVLCAMEKACDTIVGWANRCADFAERRAAQVTNPEYRANLERIARTLRKVPQHPAETFHEALQSLYLCFSFAPDSIGLVDRHLYRFYKKDMEAGILTREEAKAALQELFLMLQAHTKVGNRNFTRGGESHFCIGGYLPDGSDGFTDLSRLVLESLIELPTYIPQVTMRWTKKTPHEALRFAMDCERKDPNKRIAFVNDEPRIRSWMENVGLSYEQAVSYSMTGCNEPALPGGRIEGTSQQNIARSMANTFKKYASELVETATFDAFYAIYERELFADILEMIRLDNALNAVMARDAIMISSIFFAGCIETAKCLNQGGTTLASATLNMIGLVTVIDSLAIVRQFVYDEKRISMKTLVDAVNANWVGYEDLHTEIKRTGKFFGNDDPETNEVARRFTDSLYTFLKDKTNPHGKHFIVGNLIGYNQHNKWFGEKTPATPDGRHDGEIISFGSGQSNGRDRKGLTALLNSVSQCDPHCILTGPSVTNVTLDEQLVRKDENFEKLVYLFEAYFRQGGTHFQLNYVSKDDLLSAQQEPDKYRSLRVRVSGFSDYFVNLNSDLQNEIITRTEKLG